MTAIQFLAEWALRSSVLILSGALLLRALRVKDPSIRLAAWTAILCGSLAIPALTASLPGMPLEVMRVMARPAAEIPVTIIPTAPALAPALSRQTDGAANASKSFDWARPAIMIYVLAGGALLLRLCVGVEASLRLLRHSRTTGRTTEEGTEIRESVGVLSPVALGIVRPVILLPADWREWDGAKLEAVLAHERSHIRRRDPAIQLVSAIHRALLWHSPLSWFLHRRIVRVAEEASDDAAVTAICDRASYAEVLLDFMQRAVRSARWQGVPMARYGAAADRIHRILDGTALSRGVTRWSIIAILALGAPLAYVVAAAQAQLTFDVASVKPATVPDGVTVLPSGGMTVPRGSDISIPHNTGGPGTDDPGRIHYPLISLRNLLRQAYDSYFDIVAADWVDSDRVQVDATMPPKTTREQFRQMLRNLITDRFQLKYHTETNQVTGYALVVTKNGAKLKESVRSAAPKDGSGDSPAAAPRTRKLGPDGFEISPRIKADTGPALMIEGEPGDRARMYCQQKTMQDLAYALANMLKSTVTDATGLTATYDFTLTYAGGLRGPRLSPEPATSAPGMPALPDIFSALQSQLGLKLEPKKINVEVMVVDHIEKTPTGN